MLWVWVLWFVWFHTCLPVCQTLDSLVVLCLHLCLPAFTWYVQLFRHLWFASFWFRVWPAARISDLKRLASDSGTAILRETNNSNMWEERLGVSTPWLVLRCLRGTTTTTATSNHLQPTTTLNLCWLRPQIPLNQIDLQANCLGSTLV